MQFVVQYLIILVQWNLCPVSFPDETFGAVLVLSSIHEVHDPTQELIFKMAVDAKRQSLEMRSTCCQLSILNKADGSASFSQGT